MKKILSTLILLTSCLLVMAQTDDSVKTSDESEIIQRNNIPPSDSAKGTFSVIDEFPQFPGGDEALMNYLASNIKYPIEAKESGIQGTVFVSFIIEADGSLNGVKVLRGIGGGCDEEAIRVVENMPNWTPGKQRGKAVRVQYNLPIRYILNTVPPSDTKKKKKR